ncbi:hypothetical protein GCM10025787_25990 [Saccharopolyspora rosea]|uniref:AAA family ATPase n=1 Tax=Saccharopolyspora rosea TaxID=524884 RepID=A0ABW3FXK8_9PSEU
MSDGHVVLTSEANPFSPTAIARVTEFAPDTVTVPTPAIREALRLLDDYLVSPASSRPGHVIAIVGDYGTGKTHLAVRLLQHARETAPAVTKAVYLDAPAGTFVALYKRFIEQLELDDVRDRVREYYADIVADALSSSGFGSDVARPLRDGEIDPVGIVERFGLMESSFLQQVQHTLERVTRNEAFGTALTLLLRRGFDDAVWEWLTGHEPDQILKDRGIDTAISTEAAALEAMGVFALLYGHRDRRFVVVVDELDKVLSASSRPTEDAIEAFKKLLEVCAGARALLVLAGLPDYLDVLSGNARQRIGRVITVSSLSGENTAEFIRESQRRVHGEARLEPFTPDTVGYLVKITDGNARKIVRLCYQLYRTAVERDGPVTVPMVYEVARNNQFDQAGIDDVRGAVRRVLTAQGSGYLRDHLVGQDEHSRADYWVPVGARGAGCALVLAESVLDPEDAERLVRRATAIRNATARTEVLLVVVGYLPAEFVGELSAAFGGEPLVYDHWTFTETLASALATRIRNLEDVVGDDPIRALHDRLDRMSRQQSNTQRLLDQITTSLNDLRGSADRKFGVLQRELSEVSDTVHAPAGSDSPAPRLRLPEDVARLFDEALAALDSLRRLDAVVREAFGTEQDQATAARRGMRDWLRLRNQQAFQAVGVAVVLTGLVEAFRDGVNEWYRSSATDEEGELYDVDRERLAALCRTYDVLYEYVPLFGLDVLGELTAAPVTPPRKADLRETLDGLGARVQQALLGSG